MRTRKTTSSVLLLAIAALAAVLAGGVLAAQLSGSGDPDGLVSAIGEEPVAKIADIAAEPGLSARGVFVQRTSTGHLCLWDSPSATSRARQGGCNSADDPLGGRELVISFAYDGGPDARNVRDARLIGIASARVAQVSVLMSDGTQREISLRTANVAGDDYRAFGYRIKRADLRRNVTPKAVVAVDSSGREIDRQATGFAG